MQSYADYCRGGISDRKSVSTSRPAPEIPFQASHLPLLSRPRIRSPKPILTPPRRKTQPAFTPRSTPLSHRISEAPISSPTPSPWLTDQQCKGLDDLSGLTPPPTPIPFSRFSLEPTTPGLSSGSSSCTPGRTGYRLLTPVTPTHIRYDDMGIPLSVTSAVEWPEAGMPWLTPQGIHDTPIHQAPPMYTSTRILTHCRVLDPQARTAMPSLPLSSRAIPTMLHHFSSDGGPISALKRYLSACQSDKSISGMSLFLHCPKKKVPFHSMQRILKERKIAMEWNELLRPTRDKRNAVKIVHAVHTMNLGSKDSGIRLRSFISASKFISLKAEMKFARALGIHILVFHPGSTGDDDCNEQSSALDRLADDIELLLDQVPNVTLAIENSTHRCRGQLGRSLLDLQYLTTRCGPRLKICLDLCHIHVDQYDLSTESGKQDLFNDLELVGWDRIAAVHVSDSQEEHGGKRDLHAGLGRGEIGLSGIRAILRHPKLLGKIPYLLETPKHLPEYKILRRRSKSIQALDEKLCGLERDCLQELLGFEDRDWNDARRRDEWWNEHKRRTRAVKSRIGKLIRKKVKADDADWAKVARRHRL